VNNFYDCTSIYFGGAMMKDKDQIIPPLVEHYKTEPFKFSINNPPNIRITRYIDEIGLLGSLALVKYKLENNQLVS
ncbi:MAG: hypothetical protein ACFFCI_24015, partial [Promethearchaeota archaeon]